jgi:hypothetical protein
MFGIVPDQNGEVTITWTTAPGATWALLGAMVVKGYTPALNPVPPAPGSAAKSVVTPEQVEPPKVVINKIISVYPNPFNQYFTLSVPAENNDNIQVAIADISGRLIYQKRFDNLIQGNNMIRIQPDNSIPPGMYFARVIYIGKAEQTTIKIIKQR